MSSENNNLPLVSIIIASYNHSKYIRESIISVINQTYKNIELIIIDDASTDNSIEVIEEMSKIFPAKLILNTKNLGLNHSITKALSICHGEYVCLLASDDYIDIHKLELQVDYLQKTKKKGVYSNGYQVFENTTRLIKLQAFETEYRKNNALKFLYSQDFGCPLLQSALFEIEVFKETIEIRQNYKSDDWAFAIKIFEQYNIGYFNTPLFYYRIHDTNTHKNYWNTLSMRLEVATKLVPIKYRQVSISNIFLSHGNYLLSDNSFLLAFKFHLSSILFNFSFLSILSMVKTLLSNLFKKK